MSEVPPAAKLRVGAGKQEIDVRPGDYGLLGYGQQHHRALKRSTPLFSRVFCFVDGDAPLFFAQSEICMVFPEIKRAVIERLQRGIGRELVRPDRFMLTAQHTHCGPGGYSHYPFYNFAVPGFRPAVFEAVVDSLCSAAMQAWAQRRLATLQFDCAAFPDDVDVAFNRSLKAYNRNPGIAPLSPHQTHQAIDRRMWLLKVMGEQGRCIGQINWFGVHPTSISSHLSILSYDNKGYAAEALEAKLGAGSVAIFAQHFAGDVSPNAQGTTRPDWPRGPTPDEVENARLNGLMQCAHALRIISGLDGSHCLTDATLDAALVNRDFSNIEVDADFADGRSGERTTTPCHGLAFFRGTPVDGPGIREPLVSLVRLMAWNARRCDDRQGEERERFYGAQSPKIIVCETDHGVLLGFKDRRRLPSALDPLLTEIKRQERAGALDEQPWIPVVLPLQYLRIGPIAIIGFPGEITTVAGLELQRLCLDLLEPAGIRQVVISTYANSYCGYCTTWHEYQEQLYEGGHTVFGSRTFDAFRTEYRHLLRECLKPPAERRLRSMGEKVFSAQQVALRTVT